MPNDAGNLIFSEVERDALLATPPEIARYVLRYVGAEEYIKGKTRYCLLLPDSKVSEAMGVPDLRRRLEGVTNHRRESTEASTQEKADVPNQFYYLACRPTDAIIVPATSSERREYIPIGYVGPETLVSNAAYAAYGAEPWLFALLTSRMHMAWMRSVGGSSRLTTGTPPHSSITTSRCLRSVNQTKHS